MRIIERYVLKAFLASFFLAWLVLSFVLTVGLLVKITRLMIEGLPVKTIGLFLLVGLPETLTLTVPLSLLVSALLVFSRLSADSEIAAMRACGVNLVHIMKWPLLTGVACMFLGVYVNNEIVPRSHEIRRNLNALVSLDVGLELLEPGRFITEFPNLTLWFAKKEGNWLNDLLIFDHSQKGMTREIKAEKALVSTNASDIVLEMYKVRVDPVEFNRPGVASADRFRHVIPGALKRRTYSRKEKDLRFFEIRKFIQDTRANSGDMPRALKRKLLSIYRTEYQLRFVNACASICFIMIGVPLGIRTHRKESTIGMAVSLVVALSFYMCVILLRSLDKIPSLQPYALLWVPVVACLALAAYLIPKNL